VRILLIVHHRRWRAAYRSRVIAAELARRGHSVTLVVTADTERWRFHETTEKDEVRVVDSPDLTWGRLRSGWDPICALRRTAWLWRGNETYDLIHLFETRPATILPGLVMRWRSRAPVVIDWIDWWGRGGIIAVNRPLWYRLLFAWAETFFEEHFRPYADGTTTISYGLRDRAMALGIGASTILHIRNGADLSLFAPRPKQEARQRLGLPMAAFIIGYSAQDTYFDLDPLFAGVRRLVDDGIDATLVMSGHAPPRVKSSIVRFGLESRARFLGYLSWDDYAWLLPACDALACPFPPTVYNLGRWPGKFGEYCAAGRPIVFNPYGDLADFACGDRVPGIPCAFDAVAFAEAFHKLHGSPDLCDQLGAIARSRALADFDWRNLVDRLEHFYSKIIARAGRQARDAAAVPYGISSKEDQNASH
jgi:glycosyltransferase involved in cell wall biosynthesis